MQSLFSAASPSQGAPPYSGPGLSHNLVRITMPPSPQLALQDDHSDHPLHPPQMAVGGKGKRIRLF